MAYKNKNERLTAIEKQTKRVKELLETYHLLLRDLVVIQGDSPAYDKNGEPREEVRKKSEAAMEMYDKVIDEFKILFPIQFIK